VLLVAGAGAYGLTRALGVGGKTASAPAWG